MPKTKQTIYERRAVIMRSLFKKILCVVLSVMCAFVCVGYASLSDRLGIAATVSAEVPQGILITRVEEHSTSNIDKNEYKFIFGTTNIENTISRGDADTVGTIDYEVTVINNTKTTYFYRDIYYQTQTAIYNGNDFIADVQESGNITIECVFDETIPDAEKIEPGEEIVFHVIYTIGEGIDKELDLNMLVNVRFGIHVAGVSGAIDAVERRFIEILNTESTYNYLIDVLDNKYDGVQEWTSNYVGNVTGATEGAFSDDSVAVNTLFQNQLQMTIDGELKEVTVIIKHEPVDWMYDTGDDYVAKHPSGATYAQYGCEMVLYLTIDPLDVGGAYVPVYAMVFTCNRTWEGVKTSDWYKIGNTFIGTAEVSDYDGTVGGVGSFRTSTWYPAAVTYEVMAGYHYEIDTGYGVETFHMDSYSYAAVPASGNYLHYLLETTDANAPAVMASLLRDAERIIYNNNYAGEGIDNLRTVYYKYCWPYGYPELDATSNAWPYNTVRIFQPAISDLYRAIDGALAGMSNA